MAPGVETLALEHLPADHLVHIAFFADVANADFLHSQLLSRNADFEYAFIDASVIVSRLHVLAAVYRAANSLLSGSLKTPNVHSEIVASLSASNNIAEAYRRFGISPATKAVIVVKVTFPTESRPRPMSSDEVSAHLEAHVRGTPTAFTDAAISSLTDWLKVHKYYKLNGLPWLESLKEEGRRKEETTQLILGAMALRGL